MNSKADTSNITSDREIVLSRLIDAPRELVFEAWTDPKHLIHWWGPRGFTNTFHQVDIRTGGIWRYTMHGPDGTDYPNWSQYEEVVKPERLVYAHGGGKDVEDVAFRAIITFEAQGSRTLLTMRSIFPTAEARAHVVKVYKAIEGGQQTLDRLEEQMARMVGQEFVIAREYNVPRDLMWKVCTDPEHMKNWWGPRGFTVKSAKMDFRTGGSYLYCLRSPQGDDMWGKFVFRDIQPIERLDFLSSFSDENGGVTRHPMEPNWPLQTLSTFLFTEANGKTTFTIRWVPWCATEAERKAFADLLTSMQQGWGGTLDQLGVYLNAVNVNAR